MPLTPEVIAQTQDPNLVLSDVDAHIEMCDDREVIAQDVLEACIAVIDSDILKINEKRETLLRTIMTNQPDFLPFAQSISAKFESAYNDTDRQLVLMVVGYLADLAVTVKAVG